MSIFIFIGVALVGVFAHWLKKWCRREANGFFDWLIRSPRHTVMMLMTLAGALWTLHSTGAFDVVSQDALALAFLTGFSADSACNKVEVKDDG